MTLKTKTFIFETPVETDIIDKTVNLFCEANNVKFEKSEILYDYGETYVFVTLAYN